MSVEYLLANGSGQSYNAFLDYIPKIEGFTDASKIEFINSHLSDFNGKLITEKAWRGSVGVMGIEFATEEDLIYFKLKFN